MPSEVVNARVWKYCFLPAFFALSGYGRLLIFLGQDSIRVSESGISRISRISGKLRIFGISRISGILGSSRVAAACYAIRSVGEISGVIGNEGTNA